MPHLVHGKHYFKCCEGSMHGDPCVQLYSVRGQAPSMAMFIIRHGGPKPQAGLMELYNFTSGACFRQLCADSLAGFVDGRLPGDLGDLPESVDTGEGQGSAAGLPETLSEVLL